RDRRASPGSGLNRRRILDLGADGCRDGVDLGAKEQVANQSERDHVAHIMSASFTACAVPLRKRAGENGARSIDGARPLTRSAITSPVTADNRIPLRKCPAAYITLATVGDGPSTGSRSSLAGRNPAHASRN